MKYIREYNQFISEEVRKIISNSSGSVRTKEVDWIYDDPENSKSPSSGILLRRDLQDQEFKDIADMLGTDTPDWRIKDFIKNNPDKVSRYKVMLNNLKFLKDSLKEKGELECEYCGKRPLIIYDINPGVITKSMIEDKNYRFNTAFNPKDGATCDHKNPKSKGGDKFAYTNLAVCCSVCNNRKDDMDYDSWMKSISTNESKEDLMLDLEQMMYDIQDQGFQIKTSSKNNKYIELDILGKLKEGGMKDRLSDVKFFTLEDICEDIDRVIQYMKSIGFNYYFLTNQTRVNDIQNQDFNKISYQMVSQEKVFIVNKVRLIFTKKDKSELV